MKLGRLVVSFEWLRPESPSPFTKAPLSVDDFASYPNNSVVRNQRTGENVLVRPPERPNEIVRGLGAVGPLPVQPEDEWKLIVESWVS